MKSKCVRLVVALTEAEEADFLPPDVREQFEALPVEAEWCRLPLSSPEDWPRVLNEAKADALMTAYACPALPDDLAVGGEGNLRYVAYLGGSIKELVPRNLLERGLQVTNWGASIGRTVAECGLLLILSAMRRASFWSVAMHRDKAWKQGLETVTQSLFGKRVGFHGFGQIAQQMVPLLKPFGGPLSAYSPGVPDALLEKLGVRSSPSLEEVFSGNDVIVELEAYTAKTYHMVTEDHLRSIPPGGVFVNIGRGQVVDEEALIRVARERVDDLQMGLDVFEIEPLPDDSPLRGMPNVALLPHLAGPTKDRRRDSTVLAIEHLKKFIQGQPVSDRITTEIYDRTT